MIWDMGKSSELFWASNLFKKNSTPLPFSNFVFSADKICSEALNSMVNCRRLISQSEFSLWKKTVYNSLLFTYKSSCHCQLTWTAFPASPPNFSNEQFPSKWERTHSWAHLSLCPSLACDSSESSDLFRKLYESSWKKYFFLEWIAKSVGLF